jgi:hypothetical protein
MGTTGYQAPKDPKAKTLDETLKEVDLSKEPLDINDPRWIQSLPRIANKLGSRRGVFIIVGVFAAVVTILTILKNNGIIG